MEKIILKKHRFPKKITEQDAVNLAEIFSKNIGVTFSVALSVIKNDSKFDIIKNSDKTIMSEWFVRHMKGRGHRFKLKPTINAVHGGAGSVSSMIPFGYSQDVEFSRIDKIPVVRFSDSFLKKHPIIRNVGLTLDEYKKSQIDKNQKNLGDW